MTQPVSSKEINFIPHAIVVSVGNFQYFDFEMSQETSFINTVVFLSRGLLSEVTTS